MPLSTDHGHVHVSRHEGAGGNRERGKQRTAGMILDKRGQDFQPQVWQRAQELVELVLHSSEQRT